MKPGITDGWQRGRDHSRTEAKTIEFIKGLKPAQIDGSEDKEIKITFPSGAVREFTGQSLLLNNSLPNFYFHCWREGETVVIRLVRGCARKANVLGVILRPRSVADHEAHRQGYRVVSDQAAQDARNKAYDRMVRAQGQAWRTPERIELDAEIARDAAAVVTQIPA